MKYYIIRFFLLFFCALPAKEYVYPVGTIGKKDNVRVYVVYQKSLDHMELWLWSPQTLEAQKALLSSYTPAGLRLLPDESGFSFIDNDRIKIKEHAKRSPKALSLYEPVYGISIINWQDEYTCYFQAKKRGGYRAFQSTRAGDLSLIGPDPHPHTDIMYPQKATETLFYIQRTQYEAETQYQVMEYREMASSLVYDFDRHPIAFLHMTSDQEGYVIEHPEAIDKQDPILPLVCYHLYKSHGDTWSVEPLFSYTVPLSLLVSADEDRLYESILPLLPQYYDRKIYFSDYSRNDRGGLSLYSYDKKEKNVNSELLCQNDTQSFFAPLAIDNDTVFCGGMICPQENVIENAPIMWIDKEGVFKLKLAYIKSK